MSELPGRSLFKFLDQLHQNNRREWFNENKPRYQSDVQLPAVELVRQLEKPLSRVAPMLSCDARPHGGSVMCIYRDTRFSKDKTPYKSHVGIGLDHQADTVAGPPGIYIHLSAAESFIGCGSWRPPRETLAAMRAAIDSDAEAWRKLKRQKRFRETYTLVGESLKTSPRDYSPDHPLIEDIRRIDYIATSPLSQAEITAPGIIELLIDRIKAARPFMAFLCNAVEIPY